MIHAPPSYICFVLQPRMKTDNGNSISLWMATADDLPPSPLKKDASADVCVVGAGIAGLSIAYLLAEAGISVIVLDDGPIGGGESARTTAHFVTALDDRYIDLERVHGRENVGLIAESHQSAIDEVERIVTKEKISCNFSRLPGYLFLSPGEEDQLLHDERDATRRAGLHDVELLKRVPGLSFDTGLALRFPRQAQLHILQYLGGLARGIAQKGGKIFTQTHVQNVKGGTNAHVTTDAGKRINASSIVVATNTPVNDRMAMHTKQAAYRTYVLAFEVPKGSVPHILLWDTGPYSTGERPVPYHYVRIEEEEVSDLLIVGGEDHKTGQAHDAPLRLHRLETWTRSRFPIAGRIRYHWSGQVMEPADGLAFIGRNPADSENVFIATGDSGNGMTHGTIAGILLRDLILGKEHPWEKLYSPSRKPIRAFKQFAKENLNVAKEYAQLLKKEASEIEIGTGKGRVMQQGKKKIALYVDLHGKEHAFSAICPHLGCVVRWNAYEKTWDCPCHGSRFSALGHVVNGPANEDLSPVD